MRSALHLILMALVIPCIDADATMDDLEEILKNAEKAIRYDILDILFLECLIDFHCGVLAVE